MSINTKQTIITVSVGIALIALFAVLGFIYDLTKTPEELTTEADSIIFEEVSSEAIEEESSEPVVTTEESIETPTTEKATETITVERQTEKIEPVAIEGYFDVPLSPDLQDHIFSLCVTYDIDPALVIAVIEQESTYDQNAINYNNTCFGLMQVYEYYHKSRMAKLGVTDLFNPYQNVAVGIDILAELYSTGNSTSWVLTNYSGGMYGYASSVMNRAERLRGSL